MKTLTHGLFSVGPVGLLHWGLRDPPSDGWGQQMIRLSATDGGVIPFGIFPLIVV